MAGRGIDRFVILSGCSGGGKSTLLDELARRGHATVPEPGRRVVAEQLREGGTALPWVDAVGFLQRALALAQVDHDAAPTVKGWVFFDRGVIDAVAGLYHLTGRPDPAEGARRYRSHHRVFLVPPWPEIHVTDAERRHGMHEAVAEYDRLAATYLALGYEIMVLPRVSVSERADIVLAALAGDQL
jgi:predicted ATPase